MRLLTAPGIGDLHDAHGLSAQPFLRLPQVKLARQAGMALADGGIEQPEFDH